MIKTLTNKELKVILKSLLKNTESPTRVKRVKAHIQELTSNEKAKGSFADTRIGSALVAFQKANKRKVITLDVLQDFLYARLLNSSSVRAADQRLSENGFKYTPDFAPIAKSVAAA